MKNIYLVGFMGTGKTAVSKALAKNLARKRFDLDQLIESREKRSISDIFKHSGEPYFRKIEKAVLSEVSKESAAVVDCGGGIVIDQENIDIMNRTGLMVCLTASPEVILQRTQHGQHRPLLRVPDPLRTIEELLKERMRLYQQASVMIDTSRLNVTQVTHKIQGVLKGD